MTQKAEPLQIYNTLPCGRVACENEVTLKEHVIAQQKSDVANLEKYMLALFKAVDAKFEGNGTALALARDGLKEQLHHLNFLREKCITTDTYHEGHRRVEDRISKLETTLAERSSSLAQIPVNTVRLELLEKAQAEQKGKATVTSVMFVGAIAAIGWVLNIISILHEFSK